MDSRVAATGILIMGAMFMYAQVITTPQERSRAEIADELCNTSLGDLGQAASAEIAEECRDASRKNLILSLETPAYIIGILVTLTGLLMNGGYTKLRKRIRKTL